MAEWPDGSGGNPADSAGGQEHHNLPAWSVSEISGSVKRTIEDNFGYVRVRGEISRPSFPGSGHIYLTLKDDKSTLASVCWRGNASRLSVRPEEGLEVIATGRMTTFPGQSKYQLIIERMEVAGEGALLKLLEDRRKKLAAEGLFDPDRKRSLPFLPDCIGVVTSPTGAVIRDILHRLSDRFPRHVLVWPTRVQGEGAAEEIAAAIRGFNSLPVLPADRMVMGEARRPDLLIVARGGGSLEDLWAFNEEIVVRAASESGIPLISAVGHETDTTLIDHASDRRAPTPTAAAEMAVPVRTDLLLQVRDCGGRMDSAARRGVSERMKALEGLGYRLGDPFRLLEERQQRLDLWADRLDNAGRAVVSRREDRLGRLGASLHHPRDLLAWARKSLEGLDRRLQSVPPRLLSERANRLDSVSGRLSPRPVLRGLAEREKTLSRLEQQLVRDNSRTLDRLQNRLEQAGRLLDSYSHERVLERGFALVHDAQGGLVDRLSRMPAGEPVHLTFADGSCQVRKAGEVGVEDGAPGEGGAGTPEKPGKAARQTGKTARSTAAKTRKADMAVSGGEGPEKPGEARKARKKPAREKDPRQGQLF